LNKSKQQFEVFVGFLMSTVYTFVLYKKKKKKKKKKKERKKERNGEEEEDREKETKKKNNNLFSFELGFQINNLVELGFLKIFYLMCLT
jgi:flagellar biosynthesis component FlhA